MTSARTDFMSSSTSSQQIVEMKSTRLGIKKGRQVLYSHGHGDFALQGCVKWVGTVDRTVYAGVEFDEPIGSGFPETNGKIHFSCNAAHTRLIPVKELCLVPSSPDSLNLSSTSSSEEDCSLKNVKSDTSVPVTQLSLWKEELQNELIWLKNERDKIDSICNSKIVANLESIQVQTQQAKFLEDEIYKRFGHFRSFQKKYETNSDGVIPFPHMQSLEEEIHKIVQRYESLHDCALFRIHTLAIATQHGQNVQNILIHKQLWLRDMKSRLRQLDRNLVANWNEMSHKIQAIDNQRTAFLNDKNGDISDLYSAIIEFQKSGADATLFNAEADDIVSTHNNVLEEIEIKSTMLKKSGSLYSQFLSRATEFETWYDSFMQRLGKLSISGSELASRHPGILKEKDDRRLELVEILHIAKALRLSIFDCSALDDKIEGLQEKWKSLMEKVYRGSRGRKTC